MSARALGAAGMPPAPALSPSTTAAPATSATSAVRLGDGTLLLMAVATGLCAGSNYFNQPLLHSIATSLSITQAAAAFTVSPVS